MGVEVTLAQMGLSIKLDTKQYSGYQKKSVNPYMHFLVYHAPKMIGVHGNIKQFSGQGIHNDLTLYSHIKHASVLIHYQGWKRTMMTADEITFQAINGMQLATFYRQKHDWNS